MINVRHLCFTHPGTSEQVLSDISFHLDKDQILLLCGRNGSGKSTMLRLLNGTLTPDSGTVNCAGRCWPDGPEEGNSALLLQEAEHQILGATVLEDILLPWPHPTEAQQKKAVELARHYGLENRLNTDVSTLSYGQKRKLCIVSALMTEPDVLLLDEPSCGLDYPACQNLSATLASLRRDMAIIIATHDPDLFLPIMKPSDSMLLLEKGHCAFLGPAAEAIPLIRLRPELGIRPCGLL